MPVRQHWFEVFSPHLHAKRARSLADGGLGAMFADRLGVHAVGRGLARARELDTKHAVRQIDRLLSNDGIELRAAFAAWVPWVLGARKEIVVALDWTEYDADAQHTISCYLVSDHGRATPLIWRTVMASELLGRRGSYEEQLLDLLRKVIPDDVRVTVLADRGFGSASLYKRLGKLGFDFVIRFRGCIYVSLADGRRVQANELLAGDGEPVRHDDPKVTASKCAVAAVVTVWERGMKDPWYLATSRSDGAKDIVRLYGRRFTIEESFRDEKDLRFGLGLLASPIGTPARRDRLLLLGAMGRSMLTLIGAAGEQLGLDRKLRANTVTRRTHSLFRQGWEYLRGSVSRHTESLRAVFRGILLAHAGTDRCYALI